MCWKTYQRGLVQLEKPDIPLMQNTLHSLQILSLLDNLNPNSDVQYSVELYTNFIPTDTLGVV
jgi:hypothetical protein